MTSNLTQDDVKRLLTDQTPQIRASMAAKVSGQMDAGALSDEERRIAEDIVRMMARDASEIVREALAINLKSSRNLPRDVALALANDVDAVALPILEYSKVLTDSDLIQLVRDLPETKQTAVAHRVEVSEKLADALVDTDSQIVVETLVGNQGAEISEGTFGRVLDKFGDVESVLQPLVKRAKLPLTVTERLVTMVSDRLKDHLVTHHELSADTASELVLQTRERATVSLVGDDVDEKDVEKLAAQLDANGRLTPSLVLRSLCMGDLSFFEAAMATLARTSLLNARTLVHDAGRLGLKSLYEKAKMPPALFSAVRVAVDMNCATDVRGADYDRDGYSRTMIERILTQYDGMASEDTEYLLRKLDDLAPPPVAA